MTYDEFWLKYLRAHSRRKTRAIHYCGITIILAGIAGAFWTGAWWLGAGGFVIGYATAWAAHLTVQNNRPVMFKSGTWALWSLLSGIRMYALGVTGQLGPHLTEAGVARRAPS